MTSKKLAQIFGLVFLGIGILGFVPGITANNHLLGIFEVDLIHNIIHIATGVVALLLAGSYSNAQLFFRVFGVVYGLVTIIGFIQGNTVLGIIEVNLADNVLHALISVIALWLGFGFKEEKQEATTR